MAAAFAGLALLAACTPDRVVSPTVGRSAPSLLPTAWSEWSAPVDLGPDINTAALEQGSAPSRDGLSLFFQSDRAGGFGNVDLYVSQRACVDDDNPECEWGPAQNLGATINTASIENAPKLSPDEHWLYFASTRPGGAGGSDLWVSHRHDRRDDFGWEAPVNLGSGVNTPAAENQPDVFDDPATGVQTMYFISTRPGGLGGSDIYVSTRGADGAFGSPTPVTELNSTANDLQPAVRRDGLEMFMGSNRAGGVGNIDMYVSTRSSPSAAWSTPVNLGNTLNSTAIDARPVLSWDGTTLYFQSDSSGNFNLYRTTRHKVKGN